MAFRCDILFCEAFILTIEEKMFEQMKGLSPKKKIEYYIQYYGVATVVILIVIIAVTSFVVGRIRAKDVAEGIMLINAYGEASEDEETYLDDL